jgi:hypothetical protein
MQFEHVHDRMAYIDAAKGWLDEAFLDLPAPVAVAMNEWVECDLAAWTRGKPPAPAVTTATLRALFGTELLGELFGQNARLA